MVIIGQARSGAPRWRRGAVARRQGGAWLSAWSSRIGWNGFNVLHTAAARVGGLDLGFVPGKGGGTSMANILDGAEKGEHRCASTCSAPTKST